MSINDCIPKHPLLIFLESAINSNLYITILDSNTADTSVIKSRNINEIVEKLDEILNAVIQVRVGRYDWLSSKYGIVALVYYNNGDKNFVAKIPNPNGMQVADDAEDILKKLYNESQFFHNIGYYDAQK